MEYVVGSTNEFYRRVIEDLGPERDGRRVLPEGLRVTLLDTSKSVVTLPGFTLGGETMSRMLEWYCADVPHSGYAKEAAVVMPAGRVDPDRPANNLGFVAMFAGNGTSQLGACIKKLREDMQSRPRIRFYQHPLADMTWDPRAVTQEFRVEDGKLNSSVMVRECDLFKDLPYDLPWFGSLMARVAEELGYVGLGRLALGTLDAFAEEADVEAYRRKGAGA